jgi:hypothetical protein
MVAGILCVFLVGAEKRFWEQITFSSAAIAWFIVLAAGPLGFFLARDVAKRRGFEQRGETESPLPSRREPQNLDPHESAKRGGRTG